MHVIFNADFSSGSCNRSLADVFASICRHRAPRRSRPNFGRGQHPSTELYVCEVVIVVYVLSLPNFVTVPFWKANWGKECVSAVVEVTLMSRAPKYSLILELDRKLRDVALPTYSRGSPPKGASLGETMKHFMPINYRELSKRPFFAHCPRDIS